MCAECDRAVELVRLTQDGESVVALSLGVPGSARLVGSKAPILTPARNVSLDTPPKETRS